MKAENDIINIFTSEDVENMLLKSLMLFHMKFMTNVHIMYFQQNWRMCLYDKDL